MSDPAPPPVSSKDRARLRPSVDVAALERLIAQQPLSARSLTLLAFYAQPTAGEVLTALLAAGADEGALSTLRAFAAYAPVPPHLAHPENDPDPTWMAPVWAVDLAAELPEEPRLRALWEAVEPKRGASPLATIPVQCLSSLRGPRRSGGSDLR